MGKAVRRFSCAVIVLAVGLVWLYLPSFAFSRPVAKRPPAGAAARVGATPARAASAGPERAKAASAQAAR
jgi:hypothetical protein